MTTKRYNSSKPPVVISAALVAAHKARRLAKNRADGLGRTATFWHADDDLVLKKVFEVWHARHDAGETVRHYYYRLYDAGLIDVWEEVDEKGDALFPTSAQNAYAYVSDRLTKWRRLYARANGRQGLPWRAVVDESRRSSGKWEDPHIKYDLTYHITTLADSYYSINPWLGQPVWLEVWTEKDGMFDILSDICRPYQVGVHVTKGYTSAGVLHEAARRLGTGENAVLLYIGDCDPSGMDIERDLYETLLDDGCWGVTVRRVALTPDQTPGLKANSAKRIKPKDPRAQGFIHDYPGLAAFELESLPTTELEPLLKSVIESYIDKGAFLEAAKVERAIRNWITSHARGVLTDQSKDWSKRLHREGTLYDPSTGTLISQELLDRYLDDKDDDDDDGDEEEEDA